MELDNLRSFLYSKASSSGVCTACNLQAYSSTRNKAIVYLASSYSMLVAQENYIKRLELMNDKLLGIEQSKETLE